ncbi:hypothetical protein B296_00010581 [Ensete ventricosum]|uniref:Uncharacterized protein n=1 Tax=Ensete ventricosum TaxID=4639 RepID=A0A427AQ92_ENSVE|nr:hypothetical protein B296_00010581 [Ensete ventricosum]
MGAGDPRATTTRERGWRTGAMYSFFSLFLLFLFYFFPFSRSIDHRRSISPSIDRWRSISPSIGGRFLPQSAADSQNRPPTVDFWPNRPVAGGPRTDNLTDRYVPPVSGNTGRNCKHCC